MNGKDLCENGILCHSERLTVRRMREGDLPCLYELLSDERVMRYLEPVYTLADTEAFLHKAGLSLPPLIYAVEDGDGHFTGYIIYHACGEECMEIGWVLRPEEWHKGYADELTKCLVEKTKEMERDAVIECIPGQETTKHIALKNGFEYRGILDGCCQYVSVRGGR